MLGDIVQMRMDEPTGTCRLLMFSIVVSLRSYLILYILKYLLDYVKLLIYS